MTRNLVVLAAAAACLSWTLPALAHDYTAGSLTIAHPWSRKAPPAAPVVGGYVSITNNGSEPDRLVGGSSRLAERVEVHVSSVEDGVARMRPAADGIEIAPGETVELKPGGTHIMFIEPSGLPEEGGKFPASLTFEKAGAVDVEFAVEPMRGPAKEEPASAHHGGHGESAQ
jgi:copper(I)-binding protein